MAESKKPKSKPKFNKRIFWDVAFDKIDYDAKANFVIERVFERGDVSDIRNCRRYYGDYKVRNSEHNQIFFWDVKAPNYFWKQFISGALIAIVMTGLDQNMMQKNLSMRTLPEAQKNILWFFGAWLFVFHLESFV